MATVGNRIDALPLPLLIAAPAVILAAVSLALPESLRLGYTVDLEIYRRYAVDLLGGHLPYVDVRIEYPPLALVPMVLPVLGASGAAASDLAAYTWRFVAVAAALAVAAGALTWWATGSRRAVAASGALVVLSWPGAIFRYDLWPTLAALAGLLLAGTRPGLAGLALGAGTMLKLFPATLVPVVVGAALIRRDAAAAVRLLAGSALVVAIVGGWAWGVAGPESLHWLRYQEDRGLQLESVGASILLALHVVAALPMARNHDFGAVQVVAPGSAEVAAAAPWLEALILAGVVAVAVRRFRQDRARLGGIPVESLALAAVAAIAAPLVASKVLSMQYVVWLLPFAALLEGRLVLLAAVVAAATTAVYTADYTGLVHFSPPMVGLLLARNVLLVAFVALVVRRLWMGPGRVNDPGEGRARIAQVARASGQQQPTA